MQSIQAGFLPVEASSQGKAIIRDYLCKIAGFLPAEIFSKAKLYLAPLLYHFWVLFNMGHSLYMINTDDSLVLESGRAHNDVSVCVTVYITLCTGFRTTRMT